MSNSSLICYTKLSPNCTKPRNHKIDTITIHCMAGNMSIENCGAWFAKPSANASSNYGIGSDGRIALYVDESNRSWASSNADNDHRAVTIEVANNGGAPEWPVSDKAYAALINLVVDICKRNGIKKLVWSTSKDNRVNHLNGCNMTVHKDFANKACPGNYLYNHMGNIAEEVNRRLNEMEDEDMTLDTFKELYAQMRKELQDNDSNAWSDSAKTWAINNGIIKGSGKTSCGEPNYMWEDVITREQMAVLLYRFAQLMGKA